MTEQPTKRKRRSQVGRRTERRKEKPIQESVKKEGILPEVEETLQNNNNGGGAGTNNKSRRRPQKKMVITKDRSQYCLREEYLIQRENDNEVMFKYVKNDCQDQNMLWLLYLKEIFSRQLPNMPKEYISRLVFDRNHRSVALVSPKRGVLLGGITYRIFENALIGEIAFCAITDSEQVRGLGTRLMNHTKASAIKYDKLTHFLTFADNNALGFFSKNGFTDQISLSREKWQGFIKEYDGGTLMECELNPMVPYTDFPNFIKKQKQMLNDRVKQISTSHIVYDGISDFKYGKRLRIEDIPGVREAGWQAEQHHPSINYKLVIDNDVVDPTLINLHKLMKQTLNTLRQQDDVWPFLDPVDPKDVQDYYDIIRDPMDMGTIQQRLDSKQYYITLDIFVADFKRMINNCKLYNNSDTVYYKCALKLESTFSTLLQDHIKFDD